VSVSVDGWRLAQIFLSKKPAVFEVEMNHNDLSLRCSCPGYTRFKKCKHTDYVGERVIIEQKTYPFTVADDREVTAEVAQTALESPEAYRKFVIDYAKVEVL
jgi:hypothetical protein